MGLTSRAFLDSRRASRRTSSSIRLPRLADGLIALTGGPAGPLDLALAGRAGGSGRGALRAALRAVRRPALYRAAAPWAAGRKAGRARPARARLCERHRARRHQRAVLRPARGFRGARCADLHRGRARRRRVRAAAALDRALLQVARRDGGAVRRPARGARLDGRDRAALRVPAEDAQADPAALHRAGRHGASTRRPSCAARPRRA